MQRFHVASAVVLLLLAAVETSRGQVQYTITDLGNIGYASRPQAMSTVNGQLEIVGYGYENASAYSNNNATAWYWTRATGMVDMTSALSPLGAGATYSAATGINSSGQIVGPYSTTATAEYFVYTISGTPSSVILPGGGTDSYFENGFAAINASGQIALQYFQGISPYQYAAVCNANGAAGTSLGHGMGSIWATAINDNGWVAAYGQFNSYLTNALVYSGGAWTDLGTLAGPTNTYAINSNGNVVGGSAAVSGQPLQPFYAAYNGTGWNAMANLGVNGSNTYGKAFGINDCGRIVGFEASNDTNDSAYLWSTAPGSGVALSPLVTNLGGWSLTLAQAIDNAGDIVGYGTNPSGQTDAFLLTPVPEPSTIAILLAGAACLLYCAWRRSRPRTDGRFRGTGADLGILGKVQ